MTDFTHLVGAERVEALRRAASGDHAPIPMFLTCPKCNARHIDEGDFATKPHHTHSCQSCGLTWRPAIGPTVGVAFLPGFRNEPEAPMPSKAKCHRTLGCTLDRDHGAACVPSSAPFDHRSVGAGGGDDECSCESPQPGRVRCMNCFNHIPHTPLVADSSGYDKRTIDAIDRVLSEEAPEDHALIDMYIARVRKRVALFTSDAKEKK